MSRLILLLTLLFWFGVPRPVTAQLSGIGNGGSCSCGPKRGSVCCGDGKARSVTIVCENSDPNDCKCNINCGRWSGGPFDGPCVNTSNPACGGGSSSGGGGGSSWGGCGSCSGCPGGNSSQCVRDPSGNCLWDPGSCGAGGGGGCSPHCGSPSCGQSNGCGGSCSDEDAGAAGTPVIGSPQDDGTATSDLAGNIKIDWNNTAKADTYQLEVYTSLSPNVDWATVQGAISGGDATSKTRAFDRSANSYWASQQKGTNVSGQAWVGQDFGRPRHIRRVELKQHPSNPKYRVSTVQVQYSDDQTSWTSLQELSLPDDGVLNAFDLPVSDAHRYWRLAAEANPSGNFSWQVYDLEMRTLGESLAPTVLRRNPSALTFTATSRDYTIRVRALNTTCTGTGESSEWSRWVSFTAVSPINGQVYYDGNNTAALSGALQCTGVGADLPETSVDVTTTAGAISNQDYSTARAKTRAFDNNTATYWASRQTGSAVNNTAWIGQDFGESLVTLNENGEASTEGTLTNINAKEIRKITVRQYNNAANRVSAVYVEHSDNDADWTVLETISLANNANTNAYFLSASAAHRYWRLRAASGVGAGRVWALPEIEMFEISAVDVGTMTVEGRDYQQYSDSVTVTPEGNYSLNLPYSTTGTNQVSLVIDRAADFICSCPIGCTFSGVQAPLSGLDFYITDAREPWFQIEGGSLAAFGQSGTVITDPIPDTCAGACRPYLQTRQADTGGTSGLVVTGGGDVDLDRDTGLQTVALDEDGYQRVARVNPRAARETYEYFYRLYGFSSEPISDFGDTAGDARKPTQLPANTGIDAYFHGADLMIQESWNVDADESMVIFVDGDLTVKNRLLVEPTGFLAFIVRGDITIDAEVGHPDPASPDAGESVVEGVYIANGVLSLPSRGSAAGGDYKFVGEGTFVGWSGVELDRNYDDNVTRRTLNNTNPTEVFRYRPDFLVRAPEKMRAPRLRWQEVAP